MMQRRKEGFILRISDCTLQDAGSFDLGHQRGCLACLKAANPRDALSLGPQAKTVHEGSNCYFECKKLYQ